MRNHLKLGHRNLPIGAIPIGTTPGLARQLVRVSLAALLLCLACSSSGRPSASRVPPWITSNPETFAKWVWAHEAQNEFFFVADLPTRRYEWFFEDYSPDEIAQRKYANVVVPAAELMAHISITDTHTSRDGRLHLYWVQLDEEGQNMIIQTKLSRGVTVSEQYRRFVGHTFIVTLESDDEHLFLVPTPAEVD